jgi:uncharacterized membrane protein
VNTILVFLPFIVVLVFLLLVVYSVSLQRQAARKRGEGMEILAKGVALQERTLAVLEAILAELKRGSGSRQ